MTAPNASYDRDRVMRIIMARCGDVLTDADHALLAGSQTTHCRGRSPSKF
jgi:hypothetical protein